MGVSGDQKIAGLGELGVQEVVVEGAGPHSDEVGGSRLLLACQEQGLTQVEGHSGGSKVGHISSLEIHGPVTIRDHGELEFG